MQGMSISSGKALSGTEHLIQSIEDVLSTPIGTRVMRRDYGSRLPELIDAPLNESTTIEIYAATAVALKRWLPVIRLSRAFVAQMSRGAMVLDLDVYDKERQQMLKLEGVRIK